MCRSTGGGSTRTVRVVHAIAAGEEEEEEEEEEEGGPLILFSKDLRPDGLPSAFHIDYTPCGALTNEWRVVVVGP